MPGEVWWEGASGVVGAIEGCFGVKFGHESVPRGKDSWKGFAG